jgi:hypothetical protein
MEPEAGAAPEPPPDPPRAHPGPPPARFGIKETEAPPAPGATPRDPRASPGPPTTPLGGCWSPQVPTTAREAKKTAQFGPWVLPPKPKS